MEPGPYHSPESCVLCQVKDSKSVFPLSTFKFNFLPFILRGRGVCVKVC